MKNILKDFAGKFIDNYVKSTEKRAFPIEEANQRHADNLNLHYIIGDEHILIDADNSHTVQHMERLITSLGITPYSYKTNDQGTHKHYWFKRTDFSNKVFPNKTHFKNHELQIFSSPVLHTPGTEMAADIKLSSTTTSTAVFLVNSAKSKADRPNATQLLEGLAKTCDMPNTFCLNMTDVILPPNGNVNNSLMGVATACGRKHYSYDEYIDIMIEWHHIIDRKFDEAECKRAWDNKPELNVWKMVYDTFDFKYHDGCEWGKLNNIWVNLDERWPTSAKLDAGINYNINKLLTQMEIPHQSGKLEDTGEVINHRTLWGRILNTDVRYNNFEGIAFKNGYVDKDGWHMTPHIPFTTTQIKSDYDNTPPQRNEIVEKFLNQITYNNEHKRYALLGLLSYALSNKNTGTWLYIRGEKQTGKSTLLTIVSKLVGTKDNTGVVDSGIAFGRADNVFAFRDIVGKSFVYTEEFKASVGKDAGSKLKTYISQGPTVQIETKGGNQSSTDNTQSWVTVSNHWTLIPASDEAMQSRVVPYEFPETVDMKPSEWVYIQNNPEALRYWMWLLVQHFMVDIKIEDSGRAKKWNDLIGDYDKFWDNYKEQDESYVWMTDPKNFGSINGKILHDIYTQFVFTNAGTRVTKHMFKTALNANGWVSKRKSIDGVQNNYYERKTNG